MISAFLQDLHQVPTITFIDTFRHHGLEVKLVRGMKAFGARPWIGAYIPRLVQPSGAASLHHLYP